MSQKRDVSYLQDLNEPCSSINVHGALVNISPTKKGRNSPFFETTIADSMTVVGFNPHQQLQLSTLQKSSSPVELANCEVKRSRKGEGYNIMLKTNTLIKLHRKKIDLPTALESPTPKVITLDQLQTFLQFEKVTVTSKLSMSFPNKM